MNNHLSLKGAKDDSSIFERLFYTHSPSVRAVRINSASDEDLKRISEVMGLALDVNEMRSIAERYRRLGRDPTDIELQAIGQSWSEHCCYKSSRPFLKKYIADITSPDCIIQISEDAGVVSFDEEHAYVLGLESHNHPSAVEPYGGASTGVGGILRDVICMGAQPVALTDPLFFAPLDVPLSSIPKGTKHPLYLLRGVVQGIADYGNRMGIPTVSGLVHFHEDYLVNPLVNVGCVGIAKKKNVIHSRVNNPKALFVLCGGRTGRDGIHGVTFASQDLSAESESDSRGAVQLGNPIIKEPLLHACLEANEKGLLDGMKDLGGGGLSCVVGEMADAGGYGAEIHLEKVPLKEEGLDPWEIWVSESQERMMLSVLPENVERVKEIFDFWDVEATVIGRAKEEKLLTVYYHGEKIFEMDVPFLTAGPPCPLRLDPSPPSPRDPEDIFFFPANLDINASLVDVISHPNVASKERIIRVYDHQVRGATALPPMDGVFLHETHSDAAVLKPVESTWKGLAVTSCACPEFMELDPYKGGMALIDEAIRNIAAVGAKPHSLADNLNFGNPTKGHVRWQIDSVLRGFRDVCLEFSLPFVSGNVSLYNEGIGKAIPPSASLVGVGLIEDVRKVISQDFKRHGNLIYLVGPTYPEFGGSVLFYKEGFKKKGLVPSTYPGILKATVESMLSAMNKGLVLSCHDISHGGLAAAVVEMGIGGQMGAALDLSNAEVFPPGVPDVQRGHLREFMKKVPREYSLLFGESCGRWIVEIHPDKEDDFKKEMGDCISSPIGVVGGEEFLFVDRGKMITHLSLENAERAWRGGLEKYMEGDL